MSKRPTLITIPPSTGVELCRWVLDHYGVDFQEKRHAPILHLIEQKWYGAPDYPIFIDRNIVIAVTRCICDYYETRCAPELKLYPQSRKEMDHVWQLWQTTHEEMGYASRTWIYYYLLPHKDMLYHPLTAGTPLWERFLVYTFYPLYWRMMWKGMKLSTDAARKDLETTDRVFTQIDRLLSDGREFLVGDRFSLADMTFATMAVPVTFPAEFQGVLPQFDRLDPVVVKVVEEYRRRPAGKFALRMFREYRNR